MIFDKKIKKTDLLLILANLFPVFGVWFLGWSPTEAFIVYTMETMIVGILTVLKLLVATCAPMDDAGNKRLLIGGVFTTCFFIIHYGMFAMVQTTIFSQVAGIVPKEAGMMHFFFHFYEYINQDIAYMLGAFIVGYISQSFIPFILNKEYKTKSLMTIMFEPYGRIFVQQFTVIFGSMFLSMGLGKIFILVFALVKILFDFIDYAQLMNKSMKDTQKISAKQ